MEHRQDPQAILRYLVDQDIVAVDDQRVRAGETSCASQRRMRNEAVCLRRQYFIERQCSRRSLPGEMRAGLSSILTGLDRPGELHARPAILRCRQAWPAAKGAVIGGYCARVTAIAWRIVARWDPSVDFGERDQRSALRPCRMIRAFSFGLNRTMAGTE